MLCIKLQDSSSNLSSSYDSVTDGRTDRGTDGRTDRPKLICSSTFQVGGIKMAKFKSRKKKVTKTKLTIMPNPHSHLQTITKGPAKFQIDQYKIVGVAHTRFPR